MPPALLHMCSCIRVQECTRAVCMQWWLARRPHWLNASAHLEMYSDLMAKQAAKPLPLGSHALEPGRSQAVGFLGFGKLRDRAGRNPWVNNCTARAEFVRAQQFNFWANEYTLVTQHLDVGRLQQGLWAGMPRGITGAGRPPPRGDGSSDSGTVPEQGDGGSDGMAPEEGQIQLCKETATFITVRYAAMWDIAPQHDDADADEHAFSRGCCKCGALSRCACMAPPPCTTAFIHLHPCMHADAATPHTLLCCQARPEARGIVLSILYKIESRGVAACVQGARRSP